MIVGIKIMPRDVILDSGGRAIEESLKNNGYQFESLRAGKFLEVTFNSDNPSDIKAEAERMLKAGGLYNPLIEKFEIML